MPFGHLFILFGKIQILCPSLSCVAFLLLSCMSCSCILGINSLLDMWFASILYHSIYCLFILFPFLCRSFLVRHSPLAHSAFVFLAWGDMSRKILLRLVSKNVLPMIFSSNFMVSRLTLKFPIHFWEIFVYGLSLVWSSFLLSFSFFLQAAVWFPQHHLLMRCSFLMYVLCPFVIS